MAFQNPLCYFKSLQNIEQVANAHTKSSTTALTTQHLQNTQRTVASPVPDRPWHFFRPLHRYTCPSTIYKQKISLRIGPDPSLSYHLLNMFKHDLQCYKCVLIQHLLKEYQYFSEYSSLEQKPTKIS